MSVFQKILHLGEGKKLKELEALAEAVNSFEPSIEKLSDAELRAKTDEFRGRLAAGETLDDIEAEAYAVVREAARRVLGQRHFDVQVIGAGALHRGMVAEMRTGEGKTLVSTMPCYLNGLSGEGVHVITVNDYLAKRDAEWMGDIHRFLGLTVGLIQGYHEPQERVPAYGADITYGTNNEFGFDYLRDNMAMRSEDMVQRGHSFAIVDEVDSILIDEARTPLIISGRVADTAKWYRDFARIGERLQPDLHYEVDEGKRQVMTTEEGVARVEEILGIENMYDHSNVDLVHHLEAALKAKALFEKDVDYLLSDGEVKIVDEFTGRVLEGRRYSEGLHQAIEAKEGVAIKDENQTLATITLQNYFRMYEKLAGMTGTAMTEEAEFNQIYGVTLVEIPTNRPIVRMDQADLVYMSEKAKFNAVADDITQRHQNGQPVLVGTVSIEKSERLSAVLKKRGIDHEVLNAKQHEREATIVAQAGRIGAVTVATNMAGRGVDIRLGGNPEELGLRAMSKTPELEAGTPEYDSVYHEHVAKFEVECAAEHEKVLEAGGLYVLATERHESRRIDNQLRGRSGRQGDPGESRFYLSLEDDLMRRFASDRVTAIMSRLKMPEDVPIEAKMVSKSIERAQTQVESQNFELRKNVLKYDEVMNRQREVIYEWRSDILQEGKADELVQQWLDEVMDDVVASSIDPAEPPARWDWEELLTQLTQLYPHPFTTEDFSGQAEMDVASLVDRLQGDGHRFYAGREEEIGVDNLRNLEQRVVLSVIDNKWREHLAEMDYLRAGIGLRAMGQKDPLVEYQREGYDMFTDLVASVKHDTIRYLSHVQVVQERRPQVSPQGRPTAVTTNLSGTKKPQADSSGKIGRNEACPCGSGKKYKRCHGAVA
ncbi:MAG: preprotein translocase subunit SecA [Deltaproteobacteria bacterium]|nr:preprotein translocase subunit SecA [Deltaproteobacteria bacterium]